MFRAGQRAQRGYYNLTGRKALRPEVRSGVWRGSQPFDTGLFPFECLDPVVYGGDKDLPLLQHLNNLADPREFITFEKLRDTGAQYGHKVREWNPNMRPYILGERKGYHIIDLHYTLAMVRTVCRLVQYVCLSGGETLWVNYNRDKDPVFFYYGKVSRQCLMYDRWRPGFFTNFEEVVYNSTRSRRMHVRQGKFASPKEQARVKWNRDAVRAFSMLQAPPDLMFFLDMKKTKHQIKEAYKVNVPTIGIVDTNSDPTFLTYPIPLNDDNENAVALVAKAIAECLKSATEYKERLYAEKGIDLSPLELNDYAPWSQTTLHHRKMPKYNPYTNPGGGEAELEEGFEPRQRFYTGDESYGQGAALDQAMGTDHWNFAYESDEHRKDQLHNIEDSERVFVRDRYERELLGDV